MTVSLAGDHAQPLEATASQYRAAMRELAGGISVITVGRGDERTGLTVTSVSSLSAEPPLLLFCLNRGSSSWDVLRSQRIFAVNIVPVALRAVAERFSGLGGLKGAQRYEGASWSALVTGAAILDGALAALDCEVDDIIERGSHAIVIGRVLAIAETKAASPRVPLAYWQGRYTSLKDQD